MAQEILGKIKDKDLAVFVVWMPVLGKDDRQAALEARKLIADPRARHYWDGDQSLGAEYGRILTLPEGKKLAWDIYFVFGRGRKWGAEPPRPDAWAHQLGLDDRYLGDGSALHDAVSKLLAQSPGNS